MSVCFAISSLMTVGSVFAATPLFAIRYLLGAIIFALWGIAILLDQRLKGISHGTR